MVAPTWWTQRRFGLLVHADLVTVPAWAPIGQYVCWYRAHIDGLVPDVLLQSSPLVETLAQTATGGDTSSTTTTSSRS